MANIKFIEALMKELRETGYGDADLEAIMSERGVTLTKDRGHGVTSRIDLCCGDGFVWFIVNGVTFSALRFTAPESEDDRVIQSKIATIMIPLTYQSDIDDLEDEAQAA